MADELRIEAQTLIRQKATTTVRLVDGTAVPEWLEVAVVLNDPARPGRPTAEVRLVVDGGEWVVARFGLARTAGGPPVTPADLRRADMADMVRAAKAAAGAFTYLDNLGDADVDDRAYGDAVRRAAEPRRWAITDDHLLNVAAVASQNPGSPTLAVATQMNTSHRNASRWIAAAKTRGFIKED